MRRASAGRVRPWPLVLLLAAAGCAGTLAVAADDPAAATPQAGVLVPARPAGDGLLRPAGRGGRLLPDRTALDASTPDVGVGDDGTVAVAFADGDALWCTTSTDGGEHFTPPVRVGVHGRLAHGGARGPRVAVTADAIVIAAVHGERLAGKDGDLFTWRSTDRGRTWSGPVRLNATEGAAREGLADLGAGPEGHLAAAWIDLDEGRAALHGCRSTDGGRTWDADRLLYASPEGTICPCCAPAVAVDPATGDLLAQFRNVLEGDRDMALVRLGEGEPVTRPLGTGHWPLEACPMAGGGLAVDPRGEVLTVWRRRSEVFRCVPGQPEERLGPGRDVRVAAGPGGFLMLWSGDDGLRVQGLADAHPRVLGAGRGAALGGAPDGRGPVVAVWETDGRGADRLHLAVLAPQGNP